VYNFVRFSNGELTGKMQQKIIFRAEQSRAEQSRAEQSRAEQSRAEQSKLIMLKIKTASNKSSVIRYSYCWLFSMYRFAKNALKST
jgi:hypothetical protein